MEANKEKAGIEGKKKEKVKKKEKKGAKPKVPIKVIFRLIGIAKVRSFGPICLALAVGCLIGLIGYCSLSTLYYFSPSFFGIPQLLFGVLVGPLILALIFLFALIFCLCCCLRIRRLPRREVVLEDFGKDFMAKESLMYSFVIKLVYQGYFWLLGNLLTNGLFVSFNKFLGAKIGKNVSVIVPGTILDPEMVEIGDNTTIGADAIISGHVGESMRLAIKRVKIGKNCLIGARSFIWPGVVIEDNVTVAAGAIVLEDTYLPANTVWGGVPAKLIKQKTEQPSSQKEQAEQVVNESKKKGRDN
jgi:acetyltransferase-like isoleucine patch superfamily enzyme